MRYLPNILTIARILLTPLVLLLLTTRTWTGQLTAVVLFVFFTERGASRNEL